MTEPEPWIATPIEERYQAGMRIAAAARQARAAIAAARAIQAARRIAHCDGDEDKRALAARQVAESRAARQAAPDQWIRLP